MATPVRTELRQYIADDVPVDVGEAEVAALEAVGQFLVVDAEQMEHGRVEIVDRDDVLDGVITEIIRRAVADAAFDPAAGHPHGKAFDVVIAAKKRTVFALRHGRAAELAAPEDQRVAEHAAIF